MANLFATTTNDISSGAGGAQTPFFLLKNPSDSGKTTVISKIVLTTNVSSNNNIFRFYVGATLTGDGVALPIVSTSVVADPPKASTLAFKNPTASANGIQFLNSALGPTNTFLFHFARGELILGEGQHILVTVRPNTGGVFASVSVFFEEVNV